MITERAKHIWEDHSIRLIDKREPDHPDYGRWRGDIYFKYRNVMKLLEKNRGVESHPHNTPMENERRLCQDKRIYSYSKNMKGL